MDVDLAQHPIARADEPVRLVRFDDRHLAGPDLPFRLSVVIRRDAFEHDEDLHVGVAMQARPFTGRGLDEDHARVYTAVLLANELMREQVARELVLLEEANSQLSRV